MAGSLLHKQRVASLQLAHYNADEHEFADGVTGGIMTWDTGATPKNWSWKQALGLNEATPATAGMLSHTAGANNVTVHRIRRNTDTGPTGNFADYQSAAGGSLWRVTVAGLLNVGTIGAGVILNAVTMTLGSDAAGDMYYRHSTGVLTRLAAGATGTILIGGATPSFSASPTISSGTTARTLLLASTSALAYDPAAAGAPRLELDGPATDTTYSTIGVKKGGTLIAEMGFVVVDQANARADFIVKGFNGGVWIERVRVGYLGGVVVGGATGGDKGAGTINVATNIFRNDTAYNNPDYVLEHWATGRIERFAGHEGASRYDGLWPLDQIEAFTREHLALPRIVQARQANGGRVGVFDGGDAVLASLEEAYLHMFQLRARVAALEARRP